MVVMFMLITFGFCAVVAAYMGSLSIERKYAKMSIDTQTDLNQIGEYYLRYIEESGEQFPIGNEKNFSNDKYKWMDEEAKNFFLQFNKSHGYTFESSFSITRGGFLEFFKTKFVWRKLVVKNPDGDIKMIIELKEKRVSDSETEYDIQNWSVGDNLTDETSTSGGYQQDKLSILQRLWRFIGLEINSISDLLKNGDWLAFFMESIENFSTALRDVGY